MKTERTRYILIAIGVLAGSAFLFTRLVPRSAPPPVLISGALPATPDVSSAPVGAADPLPRPRRRKARSADASLPENPLNGTTILVDVEGAVKHPKVYPLPSGSRLFQAIQVAGGTTGDAEIASVDQAEVLTDGEEVRVLTKKQDKPRSRKTSSHRRSGGRKSKASAKASPKILTGSVNINTASFEQLKQIPGVGPVTAQAILDYRRTHGKFRDSGDVMEMDNMTPAKFAKIERYISID